MEAWASTLRFGQNRGVRPRVAHPGSGSGRMTSTSRSRGPSVRRRASASTMALDHEPHTKLSYAALNSEAPRDDPAADRRHSRTNSGTWLPIIEIVPLAAFGDIVDASLARGSLVALARGTTLEGVLACSSLTDTDTEIPSTRAFLGTREGRSARADQRCRIGGAIRPSAVIPETRPSSI